jgi:hypothetical protein
MALFGIAGIYVLPLVAGWLTAVLAGRLMFEFYPALASATIVVVGLASPLCFYSQTFWEHTTATLMTTAAALLLVRARPGGTTTLIGMAPFLLVAMLLRTELAVFAGAALFTWAVGRRLATDRGESKPTRIARWWWPSARVLVVAGGVVLLLAAALVATRSSRHTGLLFSVPEKVVNNLGHPRAKLRGVRALLGMGTSSAGRGARRACRRGGDVIAHPRRGRIAGPVRLARLWCGHCFHGAATPCSARSHSGCSVHRPGGVCVA